MVLEFYISYDIEDGCVDICNYGRGDGVTIHYWKYDFSKDYEFLKKDATKPSNFLKRMNKWS